MATDMMTQLATLVQGGMPPAQAIQYLRDAQAQEFAKMPVEQQLASNVGKYAGRVGQGLLRAAGVEDPMLAQASKMRDLATQFDTSTADGMMQYAKALQSVNPALAQQAATKSREMALTEAKITSEKALATQRGREKEAADPKAQFARANADKFTPDSLQTFMDSGKYSDLKPLTKEEKGVKPPADFLTVAVELGFGEKDKIGSYSSEQVKAINQTILDRSTRKASAGATKLQVGIPGLKDAPDVLGFRKTLNEVVKPYRDSINAADNAISLINEGLKTGNFAAVAAAQRGLAKASGETQISAADVKAFGGDPSLIGSIADVTSRLVTGTPTADTLKKMRTVAQIMKKKNEERLKGEETMAKRTASRAGNIKPEDIEDIFRLTPPSAANQITLKSGIVVTRED
jgi:hypothetical protein